MHSDSHEHGHGHTHSHACRDESANRALMTRLKRIEGQVRGIYGMLERDEDCEDIIIQISAAKAALHKVGLSVLEGHIEHCVISAAKDQGDDGHSVENLFSALEKFSRMV